MKRVRHYRGKQNLVHQPGPAGRHNSKPRPTGNLLKRSRENRLYFTRRYFGRLSRYVVTKKGESWLAERGFEEGDRIDRELADILKDLGHLQVDSSLSPAARRGSNSDQTRKATKGWDWGKAIGYADRFGEPVHFVESEAKPKPASTKAHQKISPELPSNEEEYSPDPMPAHRPKGVPARLAKKAKRRARGTFK